MLKNGKCSIDGTYIIEIRFPAEGKRITAKLQRKKGKIIVGSENTSYLTLL